MKKKKKIVRVGGWEGYRESVDDVLEGKGGGGG